MYLTLEAESHIIAFIGLQINTFAFDDNNNSSCRNISVKTKNPPICDRRDIPKTIFSTIKFDVSI